MRGRTVALNSAVMKAVEQLDYRVTTGDVATKAGLGIDVVQPELCALATEVGGHLQVAESGEIAYQFPRNFRAILRNKFVWMRLKEWLQRVWAVAFYLIRISFGIFLFVSIILVAIAILVLLLAAQGKEQKGRRRSTSMPLSPRGVYFLRYWISDLGYFFQPRLSRQQPVGRAADKSEMNLLEAIFSFLFGDGNPNANLDEHRWQAIGSVIRNHQGTAIAEQLVPYLDEPAPEPSDADDDAILPVLLRFKGDPQVSPTGDIVYRFPELQTTATQQSSQSTTEDYLQESPWRFSKATSGQIMLSIGWGGINIVLLLVLYALLQDAAGELGGYVGFVQAIYGVLMAYGVSFLSIPLIRYFWVQSRNEKIERRNQQRRERAALLESPSPDLQQKLNYAKQFAALETIEAENLAYTTETDLVEQEVQQADKIDAEWAARLQQAQDET